MLPACSSVLDPSEQPVTIFTDPPGAYCVLSRSGATVGVIPTSPGLLHVDNSRRDISVRCSKALHEVETAVLAASRRGLSIGQIAVKGAIGLAFDAGTGAIHEYPSSITVFLAPLSFGSAEERDLHYARQKARMVKDAKAAIARIVKTCAEPLTGLCEDKVSAVKAARDTGIDNLEAKRLRAKIRRG